MLCVKLLYPYTYFVVGIMSKYCQQQQQNHSFYKSKTTIKNNDCLFLQVFIGKDPDAERDWGQEQKGTTEDEMAGWHHRLDGHEFE